MMGMQTGFQAKFNTIPEAILALRAGEIIIVAEGSDPESQGFLLSLAETVDASKINFMASEARGLISLALDSELARRLNLSPIAANNCATNLVSIDADLRFGVTTGISAQDRATTIQVAVAHETIASDLRRPGHIFPLQAADGGLLHRTGQAEAGVDLARLAGFKAASALCSILRTDGELAELSDLFNLAFEKQLKIIKLTDLIAYRLQNERFVERMIELPLPCKYSEDMRIFAYRDNLSGQEHIALVHGDLNSAIRESHSVLVRVHSACLVSDLFGSYRSDDGEQLRIAMEAIVSEGVGVLVYLREEGRGLGLINQLKAYELQDQGYDTIEANQQLGLATDLRNFGVGAQILKDLGLQRICLLSNNPNKSQTLEAYGLEITESRTISVPANRYSKAYLESKKTKLGHQL